MLAQSYTSDFAKHAGKVNATDISRLFGNIQGVDRGKLRRPGVDCGGLCATPFQWRGKTSEVDFLVTSPNGVVPVEVKAGTVTHSKSLSAYMAKFRPLFAVRLSGRNTPWASHVIFDLPLYLAGQIDRFLAHAQDTRSISAVATEFSMRPVG